MMDSAPTPPLLPTPMRRAIKKPLAQLAPSPSPSPPPSPVPPPQLTRHVQAMGACERAQLLQVARANSEAFARQQLNAAAALDDCEGGGLESAAQRHGLEFLDSLNGIDVYEQVVSSGTTPPDRATRLRSMCHIETDIHEFARHMALAPPTSSASAASASASPSSTLLPGLPGILVSHELTSVLPSPSSASSKHKTVAARKDLSAHHDESGTTTRAGINWALVAPSADKPAHVTVACSPSLSCSSSASSSPSSTSATTSSCPIEFITLSYQGIFQHRQRRGWMQWCQSLELPSFQALDTTSRGRDAPARGLLLASGIVAVESATRPGQLSVSFAMGVVLPPERDTWLVGQRLLLDRAVWKRVMRLAGVKKALERESLTRTMSTSSADSSVDENVDGSNGAATTVATASVSAIYKAGQVEPASLLRKSPQTRQAVAREDELISQRNPRVQHAPLVRTQRTHALLSVACDQGQHGPSHEAKTNSVSKSTTSAKLAEEQEARRQRALGRVPSTLEFRLTYYQDPAEAELKQLREDEWALGTSQP